MSKITVSINVDSADEFSSTIRELAATLSPNNEIIVESDKPKQTRNSSTKVQEENKNESPDTKQDTKLPKQKTKPDPVPDPEEETTSDVASEEETIVENIPSVVDLRFKAQEKGKTAEGKKAIKALLTQFESKSISDVPEEKRAAFLAELEKL